ncbi:MAG: beta-ketoacyl-ACP synthase II, partial [Alphaproteobacteria bacterium]|nr:beta-ketoacyl-ACP synthase II [Alphaproteobacteria bacterium]
FNPDNFLDKKEQRKVSDFIIYAIAAAEEAIKDANLGDSDDVKENTGVIVGAGIGGLGAIQDSSIKLSERGARRISPFFIPSSLINLASGHISIKHGFTGPNHSVVTACATGTHAIGDAFRMIKYGDADIMVSGGTEAAICRIGFAGFSAARALSTSYNDTPETASRPWDEGRDGFVMGEGAGILVLEEYERAKKRGANIYAEVVGYGLSGDAYHITAPHSEGIGAFKAMSKALNDAKLNTDQIDYINAHGTSTPVGDKAELSVVARLFQDRSKNLSMSSTKSSIGHLLGAAGSVEAIYSLYAMKHNLRPATLNLNNSIDNLGINLTAKLPEEKETNITLSNSFGFGGTNASIIFKKL